MQGIHRLAVDPAALVIQEGDQKPWVDGILVGQSSDLIRTGCPARGAEIFTIRADNAAGVINVFGNIEILGCSREHHFAIGDDLDVGGGRLFDPIGNDEQCTRGDQSVYR